MCSPITLAGMTISPMTMFSIASGVMSFMGGQAQAKAAAKAQRANLEAQYQQTAEKQKQINEKAALESNERMRQGMIDRGEARTISGESGALGISSNRLISDSFMQQGMDLMSIEKNRSNQIKQTDWENKSAYSSAQGATNTAYSKAPSVLDTGLQIAGDIYTHNSAVDDASKSGRKYTSPWT